MGVETKHGVRYGRK